MTFTIDREKFKTETGKKLYDLLKKIWDNDHFIGGVMANAKGDVNRQKLIDLIEKDGINDSDTIILASLDIAEGDLWKGVVMNNGADYKKAENIANNLLRENYIEKPPVIAHKLAELSGLIVIPVDFSGLNQSYANIAGFIDISTHNLYVNSRDSIVRQNFTIAHELGHFILGHLDRPEYDILYRRPVEEQQNRAIEQEANCFAANLLVPKTLLKNIIRKYPFATDLQLGNIFGVSEIVIRIRRENLGL